MRRFNSNIGLVAAMENDKVSKDEDKTAKIGDNADSLETDLIDVNESAADGDAQQGAVDGAEGAAAALESFRVALVGIQGSGGLDAGGATILNLAVEHFDEQLGISGHPLPALESFGGASSRVQAGTIALETLGEKVNTAWKAIVAQIKKMIEWVVAHYNKVFGAAENLSKRAKKLAESSRSVTGTVKEKTWDNDRLAAALAIDNKPPANVLQKAGELKDIVAAVVTKGAETSGKVGEAAVAALEANDGNKLAAIMALVTPFPGSEKVSNPQEEGLAAASDGVDVYRTKEIFGGLAIISRVPGAGSAGPASEGASFKKLSESGYSVMKFSNKVKAPTDKKFTTLSTTDCASLAGVVAEIADELLAYRKNTPKLTELQKKLVAAAEKIANSAGAEEDEAKRKELGACQSIANAANKILIQPGSSIGGVAVNVCKSLLDYVELSLKQYAAA